MEERQISLQVLLSAAVSVILMELAAGGMVSLADFSPLPAVGAARALEIVTLLFILGRWGSGPASVGLTREDLLPGLKQGIVWSLVFGLCSLLLLGILQVSGHNMLQLLGAPARGTPFSIFLLFLVGGFMSPVAEEILFRGIIYGWLRRWGVVTAILGSTAIFSLAHQLITGVNALHIIGGLVFAVAFEVEKNLLVPITIHVLGNLALFTIPILMAS